MILIFIGLFLIFSLIGLFIVFMAEKIAISIKQYERKIDRKEEIEDAYNEKMKEEIKRL